MSVPQLQLDNQLCFLFHRISREITAAYRPLLAELGLTYPQYLVMLVLWEDDGIGVGEIGERLALDSATLSPLLRRMARAGLVTRERSTTDERRVAVRLTDQGWALRERAVGVPQAVAAHLVDGVADYERLKEQLIELVDRIPARASEATQRPAGVRVEGLEPSRPQDTGT